MPVATKTNRELPLPKIKRVGIYCRVSSKHDYQLASLAQQVSYFSRFVTKHPGWCLADIYIDVKSADTLSPRKEFLRMLDDCRKGKLDLILTKSISRFARDTVDLLTVIRELRALEIGVLFDLEMMSTTEPDSEFISTIIEAYAQAENKSRSANIRTGLMMRAKLAHWAYISADALAIIKIIMESYRSTKMKLRLYV